MDPSSAAPVIRHYSLGAFLANENRDAEENAILQAIESMQPTGRISVEMVLVVGMIGIMCVCALVDVYAAIGSAAVYFGLTGAYIPAFAASAERKGVRKRIDALERKYALLQRAADRMDEIFGETTVIVQSNDGHDTGGDPFRSLACTTVHYESLRSRIQFLWASYKMKCAELDA